MKKILITEDQLDFLQKNKGYAENNSIEVFNTEVRDFLYNMMKHEFDKVSDYWSINGLKKSEVAKALKKYQVFNETEDGEILVPKKNFERNVNRVYYELFGDQEPGLVISEEGEGGAIGGGTSASSVGGSYEQPLGFPVQRRKIANVGK